MKNLLKTTSFFLLLLSVSRSFAQYNPEKISKKAIDAYTKGIEKAQDNQYREAVAFFQEAIQRDPAYVEAYLSLAGVFGQIKDYPMSTATYEKAFALDSNFHSIFRSVEDASPRYPRPQDPPAGCLQNTGPACRVKGMAAHPTGPS